jgi:ubiquinone biosynthesis protein
VLSRFGPKLPRLVEAQLIRQAEPVRGVVPRERNPVIWMLAGAGILAAGVWIGTLI